MAKRVATPTDKQCKALKQGDKPLYIGNGLRLVPSKTTPRKTWQYKYKLNSKDGTETLGTYTDDGIRVIMSLAEAKDALTEAKRLIASGISPTQHKKQKQIQATLEAQSKMSFEKLTREWHTKQYSRREDVSGYTKNKTLRMFENHVFPIIGKQPIELIKHQDLCDVIRAIEDKGNKDTPKAIRGHLERIFVYAEINNYLSISPARHLNKEEFKKHTEVSHPSLPFERLPELHGRMNAPNSSEQLTKLFFKFLLHTFVRVSELRFARWDEFDIENRIWTIPTERLEVEGAKFSERGAKMKKIHSVPLSNQALEILLEIKKFSYGISLNVFPQRGKPNLFISENVGNRYLKSLGYDTCSEFTSHGVRDLACSALSESGLFETELVEKAMSHQTKDQVRKVYTRQVNHLRSRHGVMQWWSDYLDANKISFIEPVEFATLLANSQNEDENIINIFQRKKLKEKIAINVA
jgi:integrase